MSRPEQITFRSHSLDEYMEMIGRFHGHVAPGVLLGGSMVDLAYRHLPEGGLFDAVCETPTCLPDAIQLLTPCTIGNGWLRIMDSGRFALTMYDKATGDGVRVSVDAGRIEPGSQIAGWFFKLAPKSERTRELLVEEIVRTGSRVLAIREVRVDLAVLRKEKGKKTLACPVCGESYPEGHGSQCRHCSGELRYYRSEADAEGR